MVRMHLAQFFFLEMMLWNHLKHQCLAEDDRGTHHTYTVHNETKVFMKLHLHFDVLMQETKTCLAIIGQLSGSDQVAIL